MRRPAPPSATPTEVALVMLGEKFGVDEERLPGPASPAGRAGPFDSDRKLMSTLHDIDGTPTLFTKGPSTCWLDRSKWLLTREGKVELTPERKEEIARVNMELSMEGSAGAGLRLPGAGGRPAPEPWRMKTSYLHRPYLHDRPAPARGGCRRWPTPRRGGIRTIMITGDHKVTASAIARQLGIFRDGTRRCPAWSWTR